MECFFSSTHEAKWLKPLHEIREETLTKLRVNTFVLGHSPDAKKVSFQGSEVKINNL